MLSVVAHKPAGSYPRDFRSHKPSIRIAMPKQVFEFCDFLGPLAAAAIFALVLFVFSFFVLNLCLVRKSDDVTCFERVSALLPF